MESVTRIESAMVALPIANIDTDRIIPARFLRVTDRSGLGDALFADWRYRDDGSPEPDFPLNRPGARDARVLVAGDNFGCGSSREHAPWALLAFGFRAVISTSFADIFRSNALGNGLLPVEVDAATHARLLALHAARPDARVLIDLGTCTVAADDAIDASFPIDPFARHCLMRGIDRLGFLLSCTDDIVAFEARAAGHAEASA